MSKKIIIIGGGIAGLSAGIYARLNGYDTEIFEMHSLPGGLCTSWKRGEYTVDGCIHFLVGSSEKHPFHRYLKEVGAVEGREFVYPDEFCRIEIAHPSVKGEKKTFIFYNNADKLNAHMKQLGPEDEAEIDKLTQLIKKFSTFNLDYDKPRELMKLSDFINFMKSMKPVMKEFKQYGKMTLKEYATRFKSPYLREGISEVLNFPDFAFMAFLFFLSWYNSNSAGYPIGGSLCFSKSIEKKYLSLGGSINYNKRVKRIIHNKGRAVGIQLSDDTEHPADIVISTADGQTTIFNMLDARFVNGKIRAMYQKMPMFQPFFTLAIGIRRDLSNEPHLGIHVLDKPITIEGKSYAKLGIKHYCFDKTLAPEGKSLLEIMYTSDYGYWKKLHTNPPAYKAEKERIAAILIDALETVYPGIKADIEMTDIATPLTYERYTGNRIGTFEGWMITPKTMMMSIKKELPGLKNFYMAGQWVQPGGGVTTSVKSARDTVYLICSRDKKAFVS